MKDPVHHDPVEVIGEAYELMLERAMADYRKAKEKAGPALHEFIDKARDTAVELGELTGEEAEKLASYLKRDLTDAAGHLAEVSDELKEWLGFEAQLVKAEVFDLFLQAADHTTLELRKLKQQAEQALHYRTGEITGPGTLICEQCGEKLHFHKPGHIPPCPKCHATQFRRR